MPKIKFKKVHENAVVPSKATKGAAGYDITAVAHSIIEGPDYGYVEYRTGLAMEVPEGWVVKIYPRSSISKTGLLLANDVGIIDSDYRGEIFLRFKYVKDTAKYKDGDRIAQMVIERIRPIEFVEVEELSDTERGEKGFGSTGK